jgi:hypothetical protein
MYRRIIMKLQYIRKLQEFMNQLEIAYEIGDVDIADFYIVEIEGLGKRVMIMYDMCKYLRHVCICINKFVERYGHSMLNLILFGNENENWSIRTKTNDSNDWGHLTLKIGKLTDIGWSNVYNVLTLNMTLDPTSINDICDALAYNWGVSVF